ncbi:lyase family protein [Ornithinimicrobium pekingense]|uniref:3-carboxy-cis,cis-muconate cycloisomerase n=1 Tax=Ornithinimicrobium pekingense TaxID=384677 RepID=A0ABQ2F8C8_9MICO|nr:lyase family protein [Ornithinimicrobium pekingense]GGK69798.1 3-carboxy-cis,cis-muconate cycloisomerase [Ornithinimicrobium pekingense]
MTATGVHGLLDPGAAYGFALAGDAAVLAAMVRAELAWVRALADAGRAPAELPDALAAAVSVDPLDLVSVADRAAEGGNPVIPVVDDLRARAGGERAARFVHRGLTSQDVLDTALMLVAADTLDDVAASLVRAGDALAVHAEAHAGSVMMGRTLTQHAVPVTFGLRAAQWLASVHDALRDVHECRAALPVQCGGAAGTRAGVLVAGATHVEADDTARPTGTGSGGEGLDLPGRWGELVGLSAPSLPWHTRRRPVTRLGDTLSAVLSAVGHVATDVTTLSRPEIGELSEGLAAGEGRSSTMPHKRNPVRAVLVRASAVQAGPLAGTLHQCAALTVDERPDGAWHAEWPTLQRLLCLAATAADQTAALAEGLQVHADVMRRRVEEAGGLALSEWRGLVRDLPGAPQPPRGARAGDYLGDSGPMTDETIRRWRERTPR